MTHRATRSSWLVPAAIAIAVAACGTEAPTTKVDTQLRRMASCDELHDRLEETVLEQMVQGRYGYRGGFLEGDAVDDGAEAPSADGDNSGGGGAPDDFTTTNVQEEGVDELDLVKSNGTEMFIAQDRGLQIVKAWPADETELLAQIDLDGWARGLFLIDDQVVVLQGIDGEEAKLSGENWWGATRLTVVDVSDPANPQVTREVDIQGYVADARMVDGNVYFVLNQYMQLDWQIYDELWNKASQILPEQPEWDAPEWQWDAAEERARNLLRPEVERVLADVDVQSILPAWRTEASANASAMYACGDIYAPVALGDMGMLSIGRLDPASGDLDTTGLMAQGWQIYASLDNLYVAQSSRWWWGFEEDLVSHVHKFGLHAGSEPTYEASGEFDGWIYDQFAMSEWDGHLRVVSTDFVDWWWGEDSEAEPVEPANNVTILEDDGKGNLVVVGKVGGIAPNERIYSARMIGEKGYMVTFEQIDPLFTLDLSDHTNPRVVGELKIPGYSAYLHPMGDDHLLAVGMAGLDTGELTGLSVNLFDVSDMASPKLAHSHEVSHDGGWAWSEALWDHHAFTFAYGKLTIPAFTESYNESEERWEGFSGTITFAIDADAGISEVGRVDHRDLVGLSTCNYARWYDWAEEDSCSWDYGYWYAQVRRSLYSKKGADEYLYTVSDYGVKVNDLNAPSTDFGSVLFYPR